MLGRELFEKRSVVKGDALVFVIVAKHAPDAPQGAAPSRHLMISWILDACGGR